MIISGSVAGSGAADVAVVAADHCFAGDWTDRH